MELYDVGLVLLLGGILSVSGPGDRAHVVDVVCKSILIVTNFLL